MLHAISQKKILNRKADVLVIGAGLAGIIAAISAAEAGAKVCLVSTGQICSGSSFCPGTWGFGLWTQGRKCRRTGCQKRKGNPESKRGFPTDARSESKSGIT